MGLNEDIEEKLKEIFEGKVIDRRTDDWGAILVVDRMAHRVLTFDSPFEQSRLERKRPNYLAHNYTQAMLLVFAFINPTHITVLGLGGGCLVRALHSLFSNVIIEIVELRQAVVDVTKQHFGLPDVPYVNVTVADGDIYLSAQGGETTDIVFADMFMAYGVSQHQECERFLMQCHYVLCKGGWLVINCHEEPQQGSPFTRSLQKRFNQLLVCPVIGGNNFIIFAGKEILSASLANCEDRVDELSAKLDERFRVMFDRLLSLGDGFSVKS